MASVPPASVLIDAAYTAPSNVVAPLLAMRMSPTRPPASSPTVSVKVTLPAPVASDKSWPSPWLLATLSLNVMLPPCVASVTSPSRVTAPLYDCSPVVPMLPSRLDVPLTVRLASASCAPNAPFSTASPSMVRPCSPSPPPRRLTVLPFNTVSAPSTASSP
ncbi:hypothetical protein D3C72_1775860 [compost metagenome]